jgi:CRP-like cAMP-binding protein
MMTLSVSAETLRKIPLFDNLNESECRQLAEISRAEELPAGARIMEQGGNTQNLWVLLEGECDVLRREAKDSNAPEVKLATLGPNSVFGEMSFFHAASHSASVEAATPVKLLRIERGDYDELILDDALSAYKLAYNAVGSLAERLRRMDDWVARLVRQTGSEAVGTSERKTEWSQFRDRLFQRWNL